MSEQELLDRIKMIALANCPMNEAIHVTEVLRETVNDELMRTLAGIFMRDSNFCGCALPSFLAGLYAAIQLRKNNKALEELEALWKM